MRPTKEQLFTAITQTEQLVPAPRTLSRALRLLRDPQSDIGEIAALISRDSALSVDVLRCANSAFYALTTPVASIQQAVQVVGVRDTLRILNIVATYQMAHRSLGSYGIAAEDYCAESLYSGFFLEQLAVVTKGHDPAEAYTAGLLRLVGRLAIDQAAAKIGGIPTWDGRVPLEQWEREQMGMTHGEAGALLLSKWGFPESMFMAVDQQSEGLKPDEGDWLVLAMNFTSRSLKHGLTRAELEAPDGVCVQAPAQHPFLKACQLSVASIDLAAAAARVAWAAAWRQLAH